MLKGHVFNLQTFTSEAFALFIDKFLNGNCGVAKGCGLSNTTNSVTIADGYFVVKGRFLQIISGVTISDITNNGYYSLVCEIDLTKVNTVDQLNQAVIKTVYNASNYPTLTQQDITGDGTVYQFEFARFKVESGSITNFTDRRTYINFNSIYDVILQHIQDIDDGTIWVQKSGDTMTGLLKANGGVQGNVTGNVTGNVSGSSGSCTGNARNIYKITKFKNNCNFRWSDRNSYKF